MYHIFMLKGGRRQAAMMPDSKVQKVGGQGTGRPYRGCESCCRTALRRRSIEGRVGAVPCRCGILIFMPHGAHSRCATIQLENSFLIESASLKHATGGWRRDDGTPGLFGNSGRRDEGQRTAPENGAREASKQLPPKSDWEKLSIRPLLPIRTLQYSLTREL